MTTGNMYGVEAGILPGATFAGSHFDERSGLFVIYVAHPFFPYVKAGSAVEESPSPHFKDLRKDLLDEDKVT